VRFRAPPLSIIKNFFNLQPGIGTGLRNCQLGAIWALKKVILSLHQMK
jgi:hypothetical protein